MTTLEEIKISGNRKAFLVKINGKEVGTVAQPANASAWTVYRGVGFGACFAGTAKTKKAAIAVLEG